MGNTCFPNREDEAEEEESGQSSSASDTEESGPTSASAASKSQAGPPALSVQDVDDLHEGGVPGAADFRGPHLYFQDG